MWFALLILIPASSSLICDSDGVLCVAEPLSCISECDYLLKYRAASADTTQIDVSGKVDALGSVGYTNIWLAFGFSPTGTMAGLEVYACQLFDGGYTLRKLDGYSHGVRNTQSEELAPGGVVGSMVDGVMSCSCTLPNTDLPSSELRLIYAAMGQMNGVNTMQKHRQTPKATSTSLSLIQQYNEVVDPEPTPVDGGYSEFSAWTVCSASCGDGTRSRSRTCTNPAPAQGGAQCEGVDTETQVCNTQTCPDQVDPGASTEYGDWSSCSAECGGGVQTRTCSDTTRSTSPNQGAECNGVSTESRACNEHACEGDPKSSSSETCSIDNGCFSDPTDCTANCKFKVSWTESSSSNNTVKVEVEGNPTSHSISEHDYMWIATGFSKYGSMSAAQIYLCKKTGETYSTEKYLGYSYGINPSEDEELIILEGGFTNGMMKCSYTVNKSFLPSDKLQMLYGMGRVSGMTPLKHKIFPTVTPEKVSFLGDEATDSGERRGLEKGLVLVVLSVLKLLM